MLVTRRSVQADGGYSPGSPRAPPARTGRAHGSRQDTRSRVDRGARPPALGGDGDLPVRPRGVRRDLLHRHAAALRVGVAPPRRPRDVVRAGGVHHPLPADAGPQRLLSDGLRRQRAARPSATSSRSTRSTRRARPAPSSARCASTETAEVAVAYERFWRKLGLSVDWRLRYSTIDDHCRRTAQLSFLDLYREGPHLPVRGAGVLGSVDADVARAGRPRDDHAQLDAARHRVPRARRPRPRDLDDPARAHPELRRALLQPRRRAVRIPRRSARDRPDHRPRGADPLRRGRAHRVRYRTDDGVHLRRRRRRATLEARRPRRCGSASTPRAS